VLCIHCCFLAHSWLIERCWASLACKLCCTCSSARGTHYQQGGMPYAPQQTQHTLILRAFADQANLVSRGVLWTPVICCCFFKLNSVRLVCGTDGRWGPIWVRSTPPFSSVPAALNAPGSESYVLPESTLFHARGLPRKPPGLRVVFLQSSSALAVALSRSVMCRRLWRLSSWWLRNFWPPAGALFGRGELEKF